MPSGARIPRRAPAWKTDPSLPAAAGPPPTPAKPAAAAAADAVEEVADVQEVKPVASPELAAGGAWSTIGRFLAAVVHCPIAWLALLLLFELAALRWRYGSAGATASPAAGGGLHLALIAAATVWQLFSGRRARVLQRRRRAEHGRQGEKPCR